MESKMTFKTFNCIEAPLLLLDRILQMLTYPI
jgi:hypothetical protein